MRLIAAEDRRSSGVLLRWLPGLIITILALLLLSRLVDWQQFVVSLTSIPLGMIFLTVVFYLVSLILRSLAWQLLLQRKATPIQTVITLSEGYFFNNLLPFRIGELARGYLMGRRSGLGLFRVLSTIVVERSYDLVIAAGFFLATIPLALKLKWAEPVAILLLAVIGAALLALFFIAQKRAWVEQKVAILVCVGQVLTVGYYRKFIPCWTVFQFSPALNYLLEASLCCFPVGRWQLFAIGS